MKDKDWNVVGVLELGMDITEIKNIWEKVKEEIAEVEAEIKNANAEKTEQEFGDLLFSVVNACRLYEVDPETALERTNKKFIKRFKYLEQKTLESGRNLKEMSLAEMDAIWIEAKKKSG